MTFRSMLIPLIAPVAVASSIALTSCGSVVADSSNTQSDPKPASAMLDAVPADSIQPIVSLLGASTGPLGEAARAELTEQAMVVCMGDAGLDYTPVPVTRQAGTDTTEGALTFARTRGYGLFHIAPSEAAKSSRATIDANGAAADALGGDKAAAWWDTYSKCSREIDIVISPSFPQANPQWRSDLNQALIDFENTFDPSATYPAWSKCMAGRGYDYETPSQARQPFSDAVGDLSKVTPELIESEIPIATASAECASSTLWPARAEAERAYVASLSTDGRFALGDGAWCGQPCAQDDLVAAGLLPAA